MYDEVYSWFGCCTGTRIADCNVATACVPSKSMDECLEDESCYGDTLALAWYVTTFLFFLAFDLSYQRQYFSSISSTPHRVRASFFSFSYHYAMSQLCNSPDVHFYFLAILSQFARTLPMLFGPPTLFYQPQEYTPVVLRSSHLRARLSSVLC